MSTFFVFTTFSSDSLFRCKTRTRVSCTLHETCARLKCLNRAQENKVVKTKKSFNVTHSNFFVFTTFFSDSWFRCKTRTRVLCTLHEMRSHLKCLNRAQENKVVKTKKFQCDLFKLFCFHNFFLRFTVQLQNVHAHFVHTSSYQQECSNQKKYFVKKLRRPHYSIPSRRRLIT